MRRFPARSILFVAVGLLFLGMSDHSAHGRHLRLAAAGASFAAAAIGFAAAARSRQ